MSAPLPRFQIVAQKSGHDSVIERVEDLLVMICMTADLASRGFRGFVTDLDSCDPLYDDEIVTVLRFGFPRSR